VKLDIQFWFHLARRLVAIRDNPDFDAKREVPVWYLSHPLAPDERFTFQQNMDHIVHIMRICYEEGYRVVAPYHTICLALDDREEKWQIIGLECDCWVVRKLGYVLCVGHKLSSGMQCEVEEAMHVTGVIANFVGYNDDELRAALRYLKNGGTLESDEALRPKV
jgi:hypothetical protein